MTPDQVAELMRSTLREALTAERAHPGGSRDFQSADQPGPDPDVDTGPNTITVPRLLIVSAVLLAGMPWFLHRLVWFTASILSDLHRFAN